jgi:hypothetical protein
MAAGQPLGSLLHLMPWEEQEETYARAPAKRVVVLRNICLLEASESLVTA